MTGHVLFMPGTLGIAIATQYHLGISDSVNPEVVQDVNVIGAPFQFNFFGTLTNHCPYYNPRFLELNQISFPQNANPILKTLLSLKFIAGCDRGVRGFQKLASGCSADRPVVV